MRTVDVMESLPFILIPRSQWIESDKIKLKEEDATAFEFVAFLREESLKDNLPFVWFYVPNEVSDYSRPIFQRKQSWKGRIPGVPDYCFVGKHSFFIEFKAEKNRKRPIGGNQAIFHKWAERNGIPTFVCFNAEEAIEKVAEMRLKNL
jgi:hypothetical protein